MGSSSTRFFWPLRKDDELPGFFHLLQPGAHIWLVLLVEVAEEEGPGELLTLKPGQALGIVELLIAQGVDGGDQLLENLV